MEYLSNRKKGRNTRRIYRQNVAKYNRRYYIRLDKFRATYWISNSELSERKSIRFFGSPHFKEYDRRKYDLKKNHPDDFVKYKKVKRCIKRANKIVLRQSMDSKRKN